MGRFLDGLVVSPLSDGRTWYLTQAFRYERAAADTITVPDRFETDFASIPFPISAVLPSWNTYGPAAVVHDWLYWDQPMPRHAADHVFLDAMTTLEVGALTRTLLFLGVYLFGFVAWWQNQRIKREGHARLRPPGVAWPATPTWHRFRLFSPTTWRPRRSPDAQQAPAAPRTPGNP